MGLCKHFYKYLKIPYLAEEEYGNYLLYEVFAGLSNTEITAESLAAIHWLISNNIIREQI